MTILQATKTVELTKEDLLAKTRGFKKVHVDLGTGDARNIYKLAVNNPDTLYIGIDPVKNNMLEISKKIVKKSQKGGVSNVLLVIAAAESLPDILFNTADSISVLFPWGTLLEYVIRPDTEVLRNVSKLARENAGFEIVTTYSEKYEEGEMNRRDLPLINIGYFQSEQYRRSLMGAGFIISGIEEYDNEFVKKFHSLWAKRLAFGRKRSFFRIYGHIEKSADL